MTYAFVLENETILCSQTPNGWLPLQISLASNAELSVDKNLTLTESIVKELATNEPIIYELGRVALFESLAPSHWRPVSDDSKALNAPITSAITYTYAKNNNVMLPEIDSDNDSDLQSTSSKAHSSAQVTAFVPYRQLITQLPAALADQLSQAIQLLRWQADTQFCSRCSSAVEHAKFGERAMVCPVCRLRQYPRVQPCIITAITRPNPLTGKMQILLAHHHRYGQSSSPLQYGLIAGFVEVGESLEHAVVREVGEEVGISLSDIRYVSSQPWPFPSNLMLGFRASYAGGEIVIQEDELSHAEFFDISNLPKIPFKGSIAYDLIAQIMQEQGALLSP